MVDGPEDCLFIPETDFHFLGVDIDIDQRRGQIDFQDREGMLALHQVCRIGFIDGGTDCARFNQPAVDIDALLVSAVTGRFRGANIP